MKIGVEKMFKTHAYPYSFWGKYFLQQKEGWLEDQDGSAGAQDDDWDKGEGVLTGATDNVKSTMFAMEVDKICENVIISQMSMPCMHARLWWPQGTKLT